VRVVEIYGDDSADCEEAEKMIMQMIEDQQDKEEE
jgi:hypothetical protein